MKMKIRFEKAQCFQFLQRSFLNVRIHRSEERQTTFRERSMHALPLGVSKMLKKCLITRLRDGKRTTDVFKYAKEEAELYKQIRRKIPHPLNAFLNKSGRTFGGFRLTIDFWKGDGLGSYIALFLKLLLLKCWKHFTTANPTKHFLS